MCVCVCVGGVRARACVCVCVIQSLVLTRMLLRLISTTVLMRTCFSVDGFLDVFLDNTYLTRHLFNCPAVPNPLNLTPLDLWIRPVEVEGVLALWRPLLPHLN